MIDTTSLIRQPAPRLIVALLFAHAPVALAVSLATGASALAALTASLIASTIAALAVRFRPDAPETAVTLGLALVAQAAIFTAELSGHPWQVDSHMYFFAVLAIISALNSIPAVLAAT